MPWKRMAADTARVDQGWRRESRSSAPGVAGRRVPWTSAVKGGLPGRSRRRESWRRSPGTSCLRTKPAGSDPGRLASPVTGAYVSRFVLSGADAEPLSGDQAYTTVVRGTDPTPLTGAFGRFCSGFLGGPEVGLDRLIYFCGEETSACR